MQPRGEARTIRKRGETKDDNTSKAQPTTGVHDKNSILPDWIAIALVEGPAGQERSCHDR